MSNLYIKAMEVNNDPICTVGEKMKHTPGPWTVKRDDWGKQEHFEVLSPLGMVADVFEMMDEHEANARLIAAAPDLLEACKQALEITRIARQYFPKKMYNTDKFNLENTCATIGKAIAKAEWRE